MQCLSSLFIISMCYSCRHSAEHAVTKVPITKWRLNKEDDSSLLSYIHQHVWLLFSSLALSMAQLLYHPSKHGCPDPDYIKAATSLYNSCISLARKCLLDVDTGEPPATAAGSGGKECHQLGCNEVWFIKYLYQSGKEIPARCGIGQPQQQQQQ